jgi:L-iditol 2-dehydrogenase
MKALVLKEYGKLTYEDVPSPVAGPEDVLVRVKACAICGSDVHGMDGRTGRRIPPVVMGHEAAGVVEAVGAAVTDYRPGDRVTFDSTVSCGHCAYCRQGDVNLCDDRKVLGVSCADYRLDGAFAEFVALPARILYRIPDALSFERAALVEPLSVALHAVRRSRVKAGDAVVVVGAGLIGLLVVQCLRAAGCSPVLAVDPVQGRLDLAVRFGASRGLSPDAVDVASAVREATAGRGADAAFECVGLTPTIATAVSVLRKGGTLALVGNVSPTVDLPLQAAVTRELNLLGSCASAGEYPACLDLLAAGTVDVDPLVSAVAPLADGDAWFQRLYRAEPGLLKVVLVP